MSERTRFVGLDVHKVTIAIAEEGGQPEDHGPIANDPSAIRNLMTQLGGVGTHLMVAYEDAWRKHFGGGDCDGDQRLRAHVLSSIAVIA